MSLQTIVINTGLSADGFKSVCDLSPGARPALQNLANYIQSIPDQQAAVLTINVGAVQATATITSTGIAVANETMTVLNETLTAKASGAVAADGEFNISATVATQAANIAAAINAVADLQGKVTASSLSGVVTVKAVVPGIVGNGLQISDSLTNVTHAHFSGGSDGTAFLLSFG